MLKLVMEVIETNTILTPYWWKSKLKRCKNELSRRCIVKMKAYDLSVIVAFTDTRVELNL